jgi:uncharacterized protein YsxB (DUF464 family)
MIRVSYINESAEGGKDMHQLIVQGHASDSDICNGVSALVITLAEMVGYNDDTIDDLEEGDAHIECVCPSNDPYVPTCFMYALKGLEMLAESFPDQIDVT